MTEDIILLHFLPEATSPILSYCSGQYINVLNQETNFPLSIANAPIQNNPMITVHLRAGSQHPVAEAFLNQVKTRGMIQFTGPVGHCVVKKADAYYFIAGGTGFSPIQALLTDILPFNKPCYLYWGIRDTNDLYQQTLIATWQKQYTNFSYIPVLSQTQPMWPGKTGWVHGVFFEEQANHLKNLTANNQTYYVYASGPYPMIQALKEGFIKQELSLNHLLSDMLPIKTAQSKL